MYPYFSFSFCYSASLFSGIFSAYADLIPVSGRDLTAWKTSIPRVVSAVDSAGKAIWAFEVEIQRGDIRPEDDPEEYHWTVIRTYLEFFHLESKLTEFHGEFINKRLPPKKMFGTKIHDECGAQFTLLTF